MAVKETGVSYYGLSYPEHAKKDFEEMISVSKEVPVDFKANAFQRFVSGVFKIFRVLL